MQWRFICNVFYSCSFLACLFFGFITVPVSVAVADGGFYQAPSQSSMQGTHDQYQGTNSRLSNTNPWALPMQIQTGQQAQSAGLQAPQLSCVQPSDTLAGEQPVYGQIRPERFVTPQILESLKRQQEQYQMMPGTGYYPPQNSHQNLQRNGRMQAGMGRVGQSSSSPNGYGQNYYNGPVYGAGSVNPLYETPAVSPWGSGVDVLNHGESFPMVPREAVGGISPMYVPSYGMDNYNEFNSYQRRESDGAKVFNPFTFLPNSGVPMR